MEKNAQGMKNDETLTLINKEADYSQKRSDNNILVTMSESPDSKNVRF
jgi:hypothetical protein